LENAKAFDDTPPRRVQLRPVQRMSQRGDQTPRDLARKLRIRIQGDHEADRRQMGQITADHTITGVRCAPQPPIEFAELSAFSLPAHPTSLRGIPLSTAMEKKKLIGSVGTVALIKLPDSL